MKENRKDHWEKIYQTKVPGMLSWTQPIPKTSLEFIHGFKLAKTARIIDVGGGDSNLVDYLLEEGYQDITVLDISETALKKAQSRLGNKSRQVKWISSDIAAFKPDGDYDLWHDRATFHFLTGERQVAAYLEIARKAIKRYMVIGTFSETGPDSCSGLPVKQYTEPQLQNQLNKNFQKIRCINEDHITPFYTAQNFLFCSFKKLAGG